MCPIFVHTITSILEPVLQAIRSAAVSHCSKTAAISLLAGRVQICCSSYEERISPSVMQAHVAVGVCQNIVQEYAGSRNLWSSCVANPSGTASCCVHQLWNLKCNRALIYVLIDRVTGIPT